MGGLEIKARTVEEATNLALERLGVSREEVEVTVVREGSSEADDADMEASVVAVKPLVTVANDNVAEIARGVLEELLALMGVANASVEFQIRPIVGKDVGTSIILDIKGDDPGVIIGRLGRTLSCLQYILRIIVGQQIGTSAPIVIDVEGYKQRRCHALEALALRLAEQVVSSGEPFTLEPMPAYERRIVHLALVGHPDVETKSIDQGEARRVVIQPKEE